MPIVQWKAIQKGKPLNKLIANIDENTKLYEASFAKDQQKWNHIGNNELVSWEICDSSVNVKNQKEAANRLKTWLTARFKFLDSQWGK